MKYLPLFLLLILMLFPSIGSAATVYVGHSPDGVVRYNTIGCPVANGDSQGTLQQAVKASGYNGVTNICAGTYSGTEIVNPIGVLQHVYQNQTTQGATGNKGDVILDGGASPTYNIIGLYMAGGTVKDLTVQNSGNGKYGLDSTVNATISNVDILNCDRGIYLRSNAGGTYSRLRFKGIKGPYTLALSGTATASAWNYPVFQDCVGAIVFLAPVTATFNNPIFTGFSDLVMLNNSTPFAVNVTVNNGIFSANNLEGPNSGIVQTYGGGTWTFNNSLLADKPGTKGSFLINGGGGARVTYNNCPDTYSPKWASPRSIGKVFFFVDDTPNLNDWYTLADLANSYGYPVNLAMYQSSVGVTINWNKIARYVNNGNEIAAHGEAFLYTGTGDTVNAFVAKAVAGAIVISSITKADPNDTSTWTGTITGPGQSAFQLQSHSVYDVIKYLLSCPGVTISTATGQLAWPLSANDWGERAVTLAPGTYNLSTGGATITFTQADLYQYTMKETKAWLEKNIRAVTQDDLGNPVNMSSWTCESFVWPGGYHAATAENYAINTAGFSQARGVDGIDGTSSEVSNLALSKVRSINAPSGLGIVSGDIAKETADYLDALAHFAAVGGIHSHGFSAFSLSNWTSVFDAVRSSSGMQTLTFSSAVDWVRASENHAAGNISYRCTDETDSCEADFSDYYLQPSSPAINHGANATWLGSANVTDYVGTPITDMSGNIVAPGGVVDIGAYEYVSGVYSLTALQNGTGSGTLSASGLSCAGQTCNGSYSNNSVVNITANPNANSTVSGFVGCDSVSGSTCTVIVSGVDRSVTANFSLLPSDTLITSVTGTGFGALSASGLSCVGNTCTGSYPNNTVVIITVTPKAGSTMAALVGCDSVNGSTCTVTMGGADRSVTANFSLLPSDTLTATWTGTGSGTLSALGLSCTGNACTGSYPDNTVVNITANPVSGSAFNGWTGCDSIAGNICTVTIRAGLSPTAAFDSVVISASVPAVGKYGLILLFCMALGAGVISLRKRT